MIGWLVTAVTWILSKLGLSTVKTSVLGAIKVLSWVVIVSVYAFIAVSIIEVYTMIQDIFSQISSLSSAGGYASKINGLLTCGGIWQGISYSFPFLISSIIFVFAVFVNRLILNIKMKIEKDVKELLEMI